MSNIDSLMAKNQLVIDSLNNKIAVVTANNDSILTQLKTFEAVLMEQKIHQSYFSDIISTQMTWFVVTLTVILTILGLVYWAWIYKYLQEKMTSKITSADELNKQAIKNLNTTLTTFSLTTNEKLNIQKEDLEKLIFATQDYLNREFPELEKKFSTVLDSKIQLANENLTILNEEMKRIKNKIIETDLNLSNAKYIEFNNSGDYFTALTWFVAVFDYSLTNEYYIKDK